ncbi:MAG: polyphosphate kinase 2 family protein [Candidatus Obscuribacterales bacterium]|jgi:PPK2 family polyphosphate:nucleotide phosphotransferase|nr:polyphosphate kinase 2 family protein [Candidatus Obscuribacterales bacterium]
MEKKNEVIKKIARFIAPYKVTNGKTFKMSDVDPGDTHDLGSEGKAEAKELLAQGTQYLSELQDILYAQDRWGVLLIFQAMDAAGKDSTIKHVMSGVNPQGCQVYSFKRPSSEELDHDYMWRYVRCFPERGRIGIFNRSYYEEVLVVRIHEEILKAQHMPEEVMHKKIFEERLEDMAAFEKYMSRNGFVILKFFLHVSRKEQKKRFLARLDRPDKNWKFEAADITERRHWTSYMHAYEAAIKATATNDSPWFVVPADNKWFTRLVVSAAVVQALAELDLKYPTVDAAKKKVLAESRLLLESERATRR